MAGAGPAPVAVRHVASSTGTSDSARQASQQAPGQIATLIVPADVAWNEATHAAPALPVTPPAAVGDDAIAHAVAALRSGRPAALLLRGPVLRGRGLVAAGRIARATGARLLCDTFAPRLERGAGRVVIERLPYFAEQLVDTLTPLEHLLLVGSTPPVAFFASPGKASWCSPDGCRIDVLSQDELGARRHRVGEVDLQHRQPVHRGEHVVRSIVREQLGPDREASCVVTGQRERGRRCARLCRAPLRRSPVVDRRSADDAGEHLAQQRDATGDVTVHRHVHREAVDAE